MGKARRKDKDVNSSAGSDESKQYLEAAILESVTPEYKLREIVICPDGVDYNEWLASHTLSFFDHVNLVYGTISEYCTMSGCPDMAGPCNRQYLWIDEKGKRCKLPAPQYIDYVMTSTQKIVNDESVFPTKFDKEFPSSFETNVKRIIRLLFHVLAHIYHNHFKEIVLLNLHSHLNCIFAHLVLFNDLFRLVEEKEVEVLEDLAVALKLHAYLPVESDTPSVTPEPSGSMAHALEDIQHLASFASSSSSSSVRHGPAMPLQSYRSISPYNNNNSPIKDMSEVMAGVREAMTEDPTLAHNRSYIGGSEVVTFNSDSNDNDVRAVMEGNAELATTSAFYATGPGNCTMDNAQEECSNRSHERNRRSTSASAILFSCCSEPSLPSVSLRETRRSNSSGNGNGHVSHPYHHYHPPPHCQRNHVPTGSRSSFCGIETPSSRVSSSAANATPLKYL